VLSNNDEKPTQRSPNNTQESRHLVELRLHGRAKCEKSKNGHREGI